MRVLMDQRVASDQVKELYERATNCEEVVALLSGTKKFQYDLILEEALTNAVKHGNKKDPGKTVCLVVKVTDDELCIQVEDEGEGFNPESIPDPTDDEHLECPNGRGLFLMRSMASSVEYHKNGTMVRIRMLLSQSLSESA